MLWRLSRRTSSSFYLGFGAVAAVWLHACSIFPDEVFLPVAAGSAGVGESANGGEPGGGTSNGGTSSGGTSNGGTSSGGEAGQTSDPTGGEGAVSGGHGGALPEGGAGGATTGGDAGAPTEGGRGGSDCSGPLTERVTRFVDDAWIDSSKPSANNGSDKQLYVDRAGERRSLLALTLDGAAPGAVLSSASVTLTLLSNVDATSSARTLEVHVLTQAFEESRASWTNWGNGGKKWQQPGGDFGPVIAVAELPAQTSSGKVTFDITDAVAEIFSDQAAAFSLVVLEVGAELAAPSALAFGSTEGDASAAPSLTIQYCPP